MLSCCQRLSIKVTYSYNEYGRLHKRNIVSCCPCSLCVPPFTSSDKTGPVGQFVSVSSTRRCRIMLWRTTAGRTALLTFRLGRILVFAALTSWCDVFFELFHFPSKLSNSINTTYDFDFWSDLKVTIYHPFTRLALLTLRHFLTCHAHRFPFYSF